MRNQLVQKGFNPTVMLSENNYYRVSLMTFDNRITALQMLEKLQTQHADLRLWLLSI